MEALIGHLPRTHAQLYSEIGNRFYVRASETDFNNMTRSGYFFGKLVQNTPDGTTDTNWIVEVQAFDNNTGWTFQRATRASDKSIFTRIQSNRTWSDWEVLALKSDLPQFGLTPGIDCVSNTVTEFRVTFPKVFSKTPAVIVTPKSGAEGINGIPKYSVITVTTTGFMIRIYNDDSEQRSPAFYWIAMAQS